MAKRYIHKPIEGREPTVEILKRLKEQEAKPRAKLETFSVEKRQDVIVDKPQQTTVFRERPENIPEHNIDMLMRDIESLERKMKDTSNYLSLFYEMKELEEKFMKNVEFIEKQNIQIGPDIKKRIEYRKGIIERKREVKMGILSWLNRNNDKQLYTDVETQPITNSEGNTMSVKVFSLKDENDLKEINQSLINGNIIAIINRDQIKDNEVFKRMMESLKKTCSSIDGDIAGISSRIFIATPRTVKISRK